MSWSCAEREDQHRRPDGEGRVAGARSDEQPSRSPSEAIRRRRPPDLSDPPSSRDQHSGHARLLIDEVEASAGSHAGLVMRAPSLVARWAVTWRGGRRHGRVPAQRPAPTRVGVRPRPALPDGRPRQAPRPRLLRDPTYARLRGRRHRRPLRVIPGEPIATPGRLLDSPPEQPLTAPPADSLGRPASAHVR
jgi:hypothetical protein